MISPLSLSGRAMSDGRPFIATGRHDAGRSKIGSEPMTWWNLIEIIINSAASRRKPFVLVTLERPVVISSQ